LYDYGRIDPTFEMINKELDDSKRISKSKYDKERYLQKTYNANYL